MRLAFDEARRAVALGDGPPFGAVIAKNCRFVVCAHNEILKNKDPTAHCEMMAIRKACRVLDTSDLSGCVLYTSCEPCPMCLAACLNVNIEFVFYGASRDEASKAGYKSKDCDFYKALSKNKNVWKKSFLRQLSTNDDDSLHLYCAQHVDNNNRKDS